VLAIDVDPDAIAATAVNAERNGCRGLIARLAEPQDIAEPAPIVLANLLTNTHLALAPHYARLVTPGGQLVLGGMLEDEDDRVGRTLAARGFERRSRLALEGWASLRLTLAQAVPKGDRMEGIVRMTTELGVSRVIPLLTERGVVRLEPDRWGSRLARWQRVAREAAQQSGRATAPEITSPRALSDWRPDPERDGLVVCFWEEEPRGLMGRLPAGPCSAATVIVGPEGGLTAEEVGSLAEAGALVAGLGPRVLRTETAGAVAVALLQAHYGDLGRA
jgi:16S rRNA (uracil1498-N3)-methyltransferase